MDTEHSASEIPEAIEHAAAEGATVIVQEIPPPVPVEETVAVIEAQTRQSVAVIEAQTEQSVAVIEATAKGERTAAGLDDAKGDPMPSAPASKHWYTKERRLRRGR